MLGADRYRWGFRSQVKTPPAKRGKLRSGQAREQAVA